MSDAVEKISKACEPCRGKKVRCDGRQPCNRCQRRPADCSFRQRARIRKSTRQPTISVPRPVPSASESHSSEQRADVGGEAERCYTPQEPPEKAGDQLYQSVAATYGNEADSVESSRLFYGPSSQFAFLQQLHRETLSANSHHPPGDREVHDGGPSLDVFVQKTIFFGIAQRTRASALPSHISLLSSLPVQQAIDFLAGFKASTSPVIPLFTDQELDELLAHLYSDGSDTPLSPQKRAVTLMILATGGLTTKHTDLAELLFIKAKQEAAICDDVVSLSMIQFSILLAEYQTNIGRPNSAYLNLGAACRKALAMGLHKENNVPLVPADILQKRRVTFWCLYFHESWQALALGREGALKMSEISTSFPDEQPVLIGLCRLAQIAEDGAKAVYGHRYNSLGQLYVAAEKIGARLREFAEQSGIGSAGFSDKHKTRGAVESLQLHNVYYHVILLTYRPFLIAESALKPGIEQNGPNTMWLRQACRYAIDAAQDTIVYTASLYRKDDACKTIRYNAFFLDATCVVLMYDMLRHPVKHLYNTEYIHMALQCLNTMVQDEPVTVTQHSIREMLRVVEDVISKIARPRDIATDQESLAPTTSTAVEMSNTMEQPLPNLNTQFPSFTTNASQPTQQFIHLSGLPFGTELGSVNSSAALGGSTATYANTFPYCQNDVVTTDLFNFFPMDLLSPYNISSLEGADNHTT